MSQRIASHSLVFRPDYRFFVVRDQSCDAAVGADAALTAAERDVAAATGYELYVRCAQDLLKVAVHLDVWDAAPDVEVDAPDDWSAPLTFALDCPTGQLYLGDVTGNATGVDLPHGPGSYRVRVSYRGREQARDTLHRFDGRLPTVDAAVLRQELDEYAGVEQYRIQMWFETHLDEDEDE